MIKHGAYVDLDGVAHELPVEPTIAHEIDAFRDINGNPLNVLVATYRVWVDARRRPILPQPERPFPAP